MAWQHRSFTRQLRRSEETGHFQLGHKIIDAELNALGLRGWQLVGVVPMFTDGVVDAMVCFLKREIRKLAEAEVAEPKYDLE